MSFTPSKSKLLQDWTSVPSTSILNVEELNIVNRFICFGSCLTVARQHKWAFVRRRLEQCTQQWSTCGADPIFYWNSEITCTVLQGSQFPCTIVIHKIYMLKMFAAWMFLFTDVCVISLGLDKVINVQLGSRVLSIGWENVLQQIIKVSRLRII